MTKPGTSPGLFVCVNAEDRICAESATHFLLESDINLARGKMSISRHKLGAAIGHISDDESATDIMNCVVNESLLTAEVSTAIAGLKTVDLHSVKPLATSFFRANSKMSPDSLKCKVKRKATMPLAMFKPFRVLAFGMSLTLCVAASEHALAFDPDAGVNRESGPFDLFKFGFSAYKNGRKDEAVEAYKYAAEKGHTGSRWALANMYAYGDGVAENDIEAFKMYRDIAEQGVEPGSEDTGYFVNALISLAGYYRRGIPKSPVTVDLSQARQLYFQAASTFGVAEAQFQLAKMLLAGEGGAVNVQQAKKWLNRARKGGHAGAMGVFGNVLFQEGQTARGLAFMTASLDHCAPKDCVWLQAMQEQAFSVATENDRRAAVQLSQNIGLKSAE